METEICHFSINISQWNIVCDKVISEQDWKAGEQHWRKKSAEWEYFSPKLAFLPAIKRRRLSDSARLFFEAAWNITENETETDLPVVYASSNSEISRNFGLWHTLLQEGDVSPTSFSLSVHNALVGQWSEMRQVKSETTAIMAQKDNLETALLEAYLLLNEGWKNVLVVIAESQLNQQYNVQPLKSPPFAYALAMMVEAGEGYNLKLSEKPTALLVQDNALEWVKNYYSGISSWQTAASGGGVWQWQKN